MTIQAIVEILLAVFMSHTAPPPPPPPAPVGIVDEAPAPPVVDETPEPTARGCIEMAFGCEDGGSATVPMCANDERPEDGVVCVWVASEQGSRTGTSFMSFGDGTAVDVRVFEDGSFVDRAWWDAQQVPAAEVVEVAAG